MKLFRVLMPDVFVQEDTIMQFSSHYSENNSIQYGIGWVYSVADAQTRVYIV